MLVNRQMINLINPIVKAPLPRPRLAEGGQMSNQIINDVSRHPE